MADQKDLIYLIDMDGTLYRGSDPIPHAAEFIGYLQERKRPFALVTNCPGSGSLALARKLKPMGIDVRESDIITSADAAVEYLCVKTSYSRIYVIGSEALKASLSAGGFRIVSTNPDCVVVGYDIKFNYEKMKKASQLILDGAGFISTNGDFTIPDGEKVVPHTGSISAAIEAATGVKPIIAGKPERYLLDAAIRKLGGTSEKYCIIGDRLDTDIDFGKRQGIRSFLVLTGVTDEKLLAESKIKPTKVFRNLSELISHDRALNRD